jgi:hypothetical protein
MIAAQNWGRHVLLLAANLLPAVASYKAGGSCQASRRDISSKAKSGGRRQFRKPPDQLDARNSFPHLLLPFTLSGLNGRTVVSACLKLSTYLTAYLVNPVREGVTLAIHLLAVCQWPWLSDPAQYKGSSVLLQQLNGSHRLLSGACSKSVLIDSQLITWPAR